MTTKIAILADFEGDETDKYIHGHVQTVRGSEVGGEEGGYPADKISTMIRKDVSRGTRKFSQNSDHFAWTNTYTQMRGRDVSGRTPWPL